MIRTAILFICLVLGSSIATAQVHLVIETNVPGAAVYADTLRLGLASDGPFTIPYEVRQVRIVPEQMDGWTIKPLTYDIAAGSPDTLHIALSFPHHYRLESVPFGADVYLETTRGAEHLGDTPYVYESTGVPAGRFRVEREGYAPHYVDPGDDVWNRHVVMLAPLATNGPAAPVAIERPARHRSWIDYVAVGGAIGAGILSVHYKFRADRLVDRYRETGDESLVHDIKQLDNRAAISLGAMQVGVGVFAIRLLIR